MFKKVNPEYLGLAGLVVVGLVFFVVTLFEKPPEPPSADPQHVRIIAPAGLDNAVKPLRRAAEIAWAVQEKGIADSPASCETDLRLFVAEVRKAGAKIEDFSIDGKPVDLKALLRAGYANNLAHLSQSTMSATLAADLRAQFNQKIEQLEEVHDATIVLASNNN